MARHSVTDPNGWLHRETPGAPEALRARMSQYLEFAAGDSSRTAQLMTAARRALDQAVERGSDRSAAFELLVADALVTLALAVEAERNPAGLAEFAGSVRHSAILTPGSTSTP